MKALYAAFLSFFVRRRAKTAAAPAPNSSSIGGAGTLVPLEVLVPVVVPVEVPVDVPVLVPVLELVEELVEVELPEVLDDEVEVEPQCHFLQ